MKTRKLFLDRKVWEINFTNPTANDSVAKAISDDISARYNAPVPVSVIILNDSTVRIRYDVTFKNVITNNLNGSIPDAHLCMLTGEWKDWTPRYAIPCVPYRGYPGFSWSSCEEDFQADFKRNNKYYGGNRIKTVSADVDDMRMSIDVTFG